MVINCAMSKIEDQSFNYGVHLKRDRYKENHNKLVDLLNVNKDVFTTKLNKSDRLKDVKFSIRLTSSSPVANKSPALTSEKSETMKKLVDELLDAGILEPSKSEWSSPAFIKNRDGKQPKLCVDYKELNRRTFVDNHYFPSKTEIFNSIKETGLYSKIVLCDGYHQIGLDDNSKHLTAFELDFGKYQFTTLKDGLLNSKRHLNYVLQALTENIQCNSFVAYLDQILIFSEDYDEHLKLLSVIFDILREFNLKIDNLNSHFLTREIAFFGAQLSTVESKMEKDDEDKKAIAKIRNYRDPRNQKDLRQFLDLIQKYRGYSNDYNALSINKLEKLANMNRDIYWGEKEEQMFDKVKSSFLF